VRCFYADAADLINEPSNDETIDLQAPYGKHMEKLYQK